MLSVTLRPGKERDCVSHLIDLFTTLVKTHFRGKIRILFFFLFLFLYSFTLTIIEGPGYYPFSYIHDDGNCPSMWSGIQSTIDQYSWVQIQSKRPPRSTFFKTAHRYVLRPDHFCDWAGSWIGKRNYKFFVLFNFYGFLYLTLFTIYMIRSLILFCMNFSISVYFILSIIYILMGCFFSFMTGKFFVVSILNLLKNVTYWEILTHNDSFKLNKNNWIENFRDVFGPRPLSARCGLF